MHARGSSHNADSLPRPNIPVQTADRRRAGSRASGSGRRALLESSSCQQPIVFESACSYPISLKVIGKLGAEVAAGFCDNGATAVGQWCSRSLSLSSGASLEVLKNQNQYLYWLASTSRDNGDFLRWDGAGRAASAWLDSATGEPCHGSGDSCYHYIEVGHWGGCRGSRWTGPAAPGPAGACAGEAGALPAHAWQPAWAAAPGV